MNVELDYCDGICWNTEALRGFAEKITAEEDKVRDAGLDVSVGRVGCGGVFQNPFNGLRYCNPVITESHVKLEGMPDRRPEEVNAEHIEGFYRRDRSGNIKLLLELEKKD